MKIQCNFKKKSYLKITLPLIQIDLFKIDKIYVNHYFELIYI